ncbi:MAG: flagellar FliJ family protein [Alphaproteobacteria bacterium]
MANLDPLIRIRKHALEQKQKFLAELYRQAEELAQQKSDMLATLAEERKTVEEMGALALGYFGRYSEAVRGRVEDIEDSLKKLNQRIEIARDDMREAFAEMKKIEITQDKRKADEKRARDKKESDLLDEIAIEGFRRKVDTEQ